MAVNDSKNTLRLGCLEGVTPGFLMCKNIAKVLPLKTYFGPVTQECTIKSTYWLAEGPAICTVLAEMWCSRINFEHNLHMHLLLTTYSIKCALRGGTFDTSQVWKINRCDILTRDSNDWLNKPWSPCQLKESWKNSLFWGWHYLRNIIGF